MRKIEQARCAYCGEFFTLKRKEQRFCSNSCGIKGAWRDHPEKFANRGRRPAKLLRLVPCAYCGKLVKRYPCRLKNGRLSFCSKECEGKYKSPLCKEKYPHGFRGVGWHNVGWHHSEKTKAKLKQVMNSPEVREKIASKLRGEKNPFYGRHHTQESIEQGNIGRRAWLNDPENRRKCLEAGYKGWLILTKQLQRYVREGLPNPSERVLAEIIEAVCPNEYKYNDGWFMLNGKLPDFVNINGKKKLIELFGEPYHKESEVQSRKATFSRFGWDTLIIWAGELKDKEKVKERILSFERGGC